MNEADLRRARETPTAFGDELLGRRCGCFYCLHVFRAAEIVEWVDVDEALGAGLTALCPKCGIDAVLEETPERVVSPDMLRALRRGRFGN